MITHTIDDPSQNKDKVKVMNLKNLPEFQIFN